MGFSSAGITDHDKIFLFINESAAGKFTDEKFGNLTKKLSAYSFGIYVVHIIVLETLDKRLGLNTLSFNPVLAVPVLVAVVFAVSWVMIAAIRKIPVLKDYII